MINYYEKSFSVDPDFLIDTNIVPKQGYGRKKAVRVVREYPVESILMAISRRRGGA